MIKKVTEPEALNMVAEFHQLFDLPVLDEPEIPEERRCELRVNLLQEELNELKEAIEQGSMIGVADALADLQYVLSGAVLEFGLGARFADLFEEVHRSNMSKACTDRDIAEATKTYYKEERNTESTVVQKGDVYLVYRNSDQKVLKSVNYSEAELDRIVQGVTPSKEL